MYIGYWTLNKYIIHVYKPGIMKRSTSLQKEMEKEYYEEEVQLYRKTHRKPIIY